jgi:uncharacterized membrane protein YwzB
MQIFVNREWKQVTLKCMRITVNLNFYNLINHHGFGNGIDWWALQLCSLKVEQSVKKGNAKLIATVMK